MKTGWKTNIPGKKKHKNVLVDYWSLKKKNSSLFCVLPSCWIIMWILLWVKTSLGSYWRLSDLYRKKKNSEEKEACDNSC